ncbi:protein FAR-RED IMPAIRED RESPONSE 1-like [Chenopodium quinoa]|uniref:protein FAR-RED IMPAIRED RESPONSE 1-like n=1 Tax=Chenopodium quinoa TaxID=63459 RepID=UPI000B7748E3|nr:protein FAR-RED IMPAIRED RESPONSE 1-like [Chenopodium quinoa]
MQGKCPISIFTDQNAAIVAGIKEIFPEVRHRLCLWHLSQNANTRFGLLKADRDFKNEFHKCLSGCITEKEFEENWNKMVTKHNLQNDDWFNRLYSLKEKWCTTLSKDFFSAGILSSQRSESTNHAIGFNASKTTSLTEFFSIFQATVRRWRKDEEMDDFNCTKGIPKSDLCMSPLLIHASMVYTHTLFRDFEEEFKYAMASNVELLDPKENNITYRVYINGISGSYHKVWLNFSTGDIHCECKNFEELGWLCFHCIRVLHLYSFNKIPDHYISARLTKFAKKEVWERHDKKKRERGELNNYTPWIRRQYNLVLKSHKIAKARKFLEENFKKTNIIVDKIIKEDEQRRAAEEAKAVEKAKAAAQQAKATTTDGSHQALSSSGLTILDPDRATTKGKDNKRIKGNYDLYKKANKKREKKT